MKVSSLLLPITSHESTTVLICWILAHFEQSADSLAAVEQGAD